MWLDLALPVGPCTSPLQGYTCQRPRNRAVCWLLQCSLHRGRTIQGARVGEVKRATAAKLLNGRQTQVVKVVLPVPDRSSYFSVACKIDPRNRFLESDEANNTQSATFRAGLRSANGYAIELIDFEKQWPMGTYGHRTVRFKVLQPGGIDQPDRNFTDFQFGWQAQCQLISMPWVRIREKGNMTHLPFGNLPGRGKTQAVSAWFNPVNLSGKPRLEAMPPVLPMECKLLVGVYLPITTPSGTDLRIKMVFWSRSAKYQLANPER